MAPPCRTSRLLLFLALAPTAASAQEPEWNAPWALALIARAQGVRQRSSGDPDLRGYQASATGHVFFLVDRPGQERRTLIKADQIALEVFWRAPRDTRQRIVGQRDEMVLPTNIRYHIDHLTVVQDDFGDLIRIGDGDEVSEVAHPAAPGAEGVYDFRLGDSLSIAFGGAGGEVQVQEIQVRPRDAGRPGFVGSVYVDRASAAIVRMTFTFTPASYVDSYLDYIRISLDNSLWEGKWWLPYRQEVEIRRELPQLDFLAGSVIRGRFEIGGYAFNQDMPDGFFQGSRVTAVTEEQRRAFAFDAPLVPAAESEELEPTPTLQQVRAQALQLTAGRYLSGLSRFRLHVPSASHLFRWNRAEGAFVGLGFSWQATGTAVLKADGGWAFGRSEPAIRVALEDVEGRAGGRATWNQLRDLGPFPGASGAINTLSALTAERDWLDPWFSSGIELFFGSRASAVPTRVALVAEHHDTAWTALDSAAAARFRPLPAVDEGWLIAIEARHEPRLTGALELALTARVASFDPATDATSDRFGALLGALSWERGGSGGAPALLAQMDGGVVIGRVPRQQRFVLGGRGTLPGHPYRAQVGDAFWLARAEVSQPLLAPWVALRARAAAGAVSGGGALVSAGAGLGLGWDVLHLDLARGLDGGEWELVVSVDRRFRGWL